MTIQQQFIEFALQSNVLRFGEFKTKAGRLSPYFFNAGLFNTGSLLDRLGEFYAKTLLAAKEEGRIEFDMIFGPPTRRSARRVRRHRPLAPRLRRTLAFNRKEAKDHGEGGVIVGAPSRGRSSSSTTSSARARRSANPSRSSSSAAPNLRAS